jgi:uncharacterized DUF497 family protein
MDKVRWDWDPQKNLINQTKHGLSFELAVHVFNDPYYISGDDPSEAEVRWRTIGRIGDATVLVVHTAPTIDESGAEVGRIISARKATRGERWAYENV